MNLKTQIIQQIQSGIVVKIVPSSIKGAGVGVVALTPIEKGEIVFQPEKNCFIQWGEVSFASEESIQHIKSVCNNDEFGFWLDRPVNEIGASYFVNHSDEPNLTHDLSTDIYFAAKNIEIGEELTCKYLSNEIDWV
jgi:SET domain-containing protein